MTHQHLRRHGEVGILRCSGSGHGEARVGVRESMTTTEARRACAYARSSRQHDRLQEQLGG